MDMLEKAARALSDHFGCEWGAMSDADRNMIRGYVRAALLAIREPDDAMVRAFWSAPNADGYIYDAPGLTDSRGNMHTYEEWYGDGEQFRSAFTAMIDAILTTDATKEMK